jgi:hypothetical protein
MAIVKGNLIVDEDLNVDGASDALGGTVHYNNLSDSNQAVSDDTETDILGLTAKAFPSGRHAPDGTKTYWVDAVVNVTKNNDGYAVLRCYTGSNGNKSDTVKCAGWAFISNGQQGVLTISVIITPSAGDKIGLSIQSESSGAGNDVVVERGATLDNLGGYLTITRFT